MLLSRTWRAILNLLPPIFAVQCMFTPEGERVTDRVAALEKHMLRVVPPSTTIPPVIEERLCAIEQRLTEYSEQQRARSDSDEAEELLKLVEDLETHRADSALKITRLEAAVAELQARLHGIDVSSQSAHVPAPTHLQAATAAPAPTPASALDTAALARLELAVAALQESASASASASTSASTSASASALTVNMSSALTAAQHNDDIECLNNSVSTVATALQETAAMVHDLECKVRGAGWPIPLSGVYILG